MEEIEGIDALPSVFSVESPDAALGILDQGIVLRHALLRRVGEVGEQGEMEVRVRVAQVMAFQLLQQEWDIAFVGEQGGNDHHCATFGGDTLVEVQLGQHVRRDSAGDEQVDQVDGHC